MINGRDISRAALGPGRTHMRRRRIAVVDADLSLRSRVSSALPGRELAFFDDEDIPRQSWDLILIGTASRSTLGAIATARALRTAGFKVPIILVHAESSEELAIAALREGVQDYVQASGAKDELRRAIQGCLEAGGREPAAECAMVGESRVMRDVRAWIGRMAESDSTVLITGETGTGKELTAELIHAISRRRGRPLVCVNCAAIPDGLLESELFGHERGAFTGAHAASAGKLKDADGGTVFFDEIGDMSPFAQAKILRAVENRQVEPLGAGKSFRIDVRFIAATNQDLERAVAENRFRTDLYYRLNVGRIELPSLRERREDIDPLARHIIGELNQRFGRQVESLDEDLLERLRRYDWPGNVRELRNVIEAAYVNAPSRILGARDLPAFFRRRIEEARELPPLERDRVLAALNATHWNKTLAARQLHCSRMTLYRKMAKLAITRLKAEAAGACTSL